MNFRDFRSDVHRVIDAVYASFRSELHQQWPAVENDPMNFSMSEEVQYFALEDGSETSGQGQRSTRGWQS